MAATAAIIAVAVGTTAYTVESGNNQRRAAEQLATSQEQKASVLQSQAQTEKDAEAARQKSIALRDQQRDVATAGRTMNTGKNSTILTSPLGIAGGQTSAGGGQVSGTKTLLGM